MPEIRSVSVRLDADVASYVAKMKLAGDATDRAFSSSSRHIDTTNRSLTTTEQTLGKVDTEARKVSTSTRQLGSDIDRTRLKVDTGAKSIDRYSGRLGALLDVGLTLGPGLIPVLTEAVPLTAAMGANLVFAGTGLGVTKLALLGVGDALKAVNKAAVEPTAQNLQAARTALRGLSPEARSFVLQLQGLRPVVNDLRDIAAKGLLPGAGQGLEALMGDLPIVKRGVRGISDELGILARDAGDSLSSQRWKPFLRFVSNEAPTGLAVMGRSVGDVAHGVSQLVMDMQPLTDDVDRGILRVAQDFDKWATSLDKTRGYQSFLAYVDENGPRVVDLLDNTATAVFDIGRAAAPLGGPVLDTLNLFLRVVDALAKSDLGTPIFTGVLALRLFTRAEQLWAATSKTAVGQFIISQKEAVQAIRQTTTEEQRAAMTAEELAAAQGKTSAAWSTLRGGAIKTGLAVGGLAAVSTGLTDKMHLTNTVTLASAGLIAGPWGAAVGAGIGLLLDWKSGQQKSAAAQADFTNTLNQQTGAITQNTRVLAAQTLQQDGALDSAEKLGISTHLLLDATLGHAAAQQKLQAQLDAMTGKTQPAYIAGGRGMYSINQEQALAAGKLSDEYLTISGRIKGQQDDWKQLNGALGRNVTVTQNTSRAHRLLSRDLAAERSAAKSAVQQWSPFTKTLGDAHKTLDTFIHDLARQAAALVQFGHNAETAARKGLDQGLIKSLRDAGPEGALRMKQLANASQSEIAKANHAWNSWTGAIDSSTNALTHATSKSWKIRIDDAQALSALRSISSELTGLRNRTIRITTIHTAGGRSMAGYAAGGTIGGPRFPYRDKVLTPTAPGEEVTPNDRGQADMNHGPLKAAARGARLAVIDGPGYAAGGTVPGWQQASTHITTTTSSHRTVERIVERLPDRMRLAVDPDGLYAVIDQGAQANYQANHDYERAIAGG